MDYNRPDSRSVPSEFTRFQNNFHPTKQRRIRNSSTNWRDSDFLLSCPLEVIQSWISSINMIWSFHFFFLHFLQQIINMIWYQVHIIRSLLRWIILPPFLLPSGTKKITKHIKWLQNSWETSIKVLFFPKNGPKLHHRCDIDQVRSLQHTLKAAATPSKNIISSVGGVPSIWRPNRSRALGASGSSSNYTLSSRTSSACTSSSILRHLSHPPYWKIPGLKKKT